MKIEIYTVNEYQVPEALSRIALYSEPALVAKYDEQVLAYFGLIPQTILSTDAYFWVHTLPEIEKHRLIFARESRSVINRMLQHYDRIFGHCFTPSAKNWIRWAGATIDGNTFEFRRT